MNEILNYSRQAIDSFDVKSVSQTLKNDLLTQGNILERFEKALKNYLRAKYCVVTSSGTSALQIAGRLMNFKKGDKVLLSPLTFCAAANVVISYGATPVFLDVEYDTCNISLLELLKYLKKTKNVKALIATDYGGVPCDWKKIYKICKKKNILIINDNCHSLGSKYYGRKDYAAKYADIVIQSFHPVKHITTGEGGALITNNKKIFQKAFNLRSHGIIRNLKKYWIYDIKQFSFNYRISEINCALGLTQLKKLDKRINFKRKVARNYDRFFKKFNFIKIPQNNKVLFNSYHLYPLKIEFDKIKSSRYELFKFFLKKNIRLQLHYVPTYRLSVFKKYKKFGSFNNTEKLYNQIVSIPMFYNMSSKELKKVKKTFLDFFKNKKITL